MKTTVKYVVLKSLDYQLGTPLFQEELEGYKVEYRKDGSRYFSLPTGNERLEDYI